MLETELATICQGGDDVPQVYRTHWQEDLQKLRVLLERECAAQVCFTLLLFRHLQ